VIRFGVSGLPPRDTDDDAFLDELAARGHQAYELSFVDGFPWKERRCRSFGELAAQRGIALSVHAPYFAPLTVVDTTKAKRAHAALEHTMKLGSALGAHIVVAHAGNMGDRTPDSVHRRVAAAVESLAPKVRHLGVALGLETAGTRLAFGSLGDIALITADFPFVRPVVDWAHLHAMSNGALTTAEAFRAVLVFLRAEFPGWMIDPLHCQFSDNEFGAGGEIRHIAYGEGTLRVTPLVEAALGEGMRLTLISEARDADSHDAIHREMVQALAEPPFQGGVGRILGSGKVEFPAAIPVHEENGSDIPAVSTRRVRLGNLDKPFFPDGYTKGDLLQYYASVAPVLLPHLADRAIVMARFPDGAGGDWFYEKQAPAHRPDWLQTASLWSEQRGEPIDFVTAADVDSLLWIVNLGAIEMHPWLSRLPSADRPDFAVFDLDPAEGAGWGQVVYVAGLVKVVLDRLGLASYPKTSGATGMHIYVPVEPVHCYRRVREFVETVGRMLLTADPDAVTMEWEKEKRRGKVFIDHNQNVAGKTIASVYSARPREGAPVSTPLLWDEVAEVNPEVLTIATVWDRLTRFGDLFAPVLGGGQCLDEAEKALGV